MYVSGVGTKRCDVHDNIVLDSGTQAASTPQAGIYLDGVSNFLISGNRVQDTRPSGSKTQGPGVNLTNTASNNLIVGNDLSENSGGAVQEQPPNAGTKVSSENLT
jgi:nitrous oxidase accessory protein NosD